MENNENNEQQEIGDPRPIRAHPALQALSWLGGVAVGGAFIVLLLVSPYRTCGATRSVRLKWQQINRAGEIRATSKCDSQPASTERRAQGLQPAVATTDERAEVTSDDPSD